MAAVARTSTSSIPENLAVATVLPNGGTLLDGSEEELWVHRDKLLRIESEEMLAEDGERGRSRSAERLPAPQQHQRAKRSTSSRIPVSVAKLPAERERSATLPLNSAPTSVSSTSPVTSRPTSSSKAKLPSKPGPASKRKQPHSRASSASTRARTPRPLSINRPEGDAPWLATMYKPDPRLPQDEQVIPTHAKRLEMERLKREGHEVPVQDDFPPSAWPPEHDSNKTSTPPPEPPNIAEQPSKNPVVAASRSNSVYFAGTPQGWIEPPGPATGTNAPGYRITPSIAQQGQQSAGSRPPVAAIRTMDPEQVDEKEPRRGFRSKCCCGVM
ncbi:hypothetical protein K470DRAFT_257573 [Piedraia hortae CBS 480.64]|uniref:Uncharacterized protein n=1 Tax=Piedraia hortae CBS 480.64 TaxID=1314780 RepID=A0A6A7C261_9PEZI|nr:hypothetical protein K470DRAFT_257573 [Piedraia hortae CBS 480.64]